MSVHFSEHTVNSFDLQVLERILLLPTPGCQAWTVPASPLHCVPLLRFEHLVQDTHGGDRILHLTPPCREKDMCWITQPRLLGLLIMITTLWESEGASLEEL